jgi:hypothetical protein
MTSSTIFSEHSLITASAWVSNGGFKNRRIDIAVPILIAGAAATAPGRSVVGALFPEQPARLPI